MCTEGSHNGRHGKILLYDRYHAPHWKSRPLYILAAWMKLFAATRSKRKFNNPVSFDEKRPSRFLKSCAKSVVQGRNGDYQATGEWGAKPYLLICHNLYTKPDLVGSDGALA